MKEISDEAAILEVELSDDQTDISAEINVIKEVTKDDNYKND